MKIVITRAIGYSIHIPAMTRRDIKARDNSKTLGKGTIDPITENTTPASRLIG